MQDSKGLKLSEEEKKSIREHILSFYEELYAYAHRLTSDETQAQDLVQETYLIFLQKAERTFEISDAKPFFFELICRLFIKQSKRSSKIELNADFLEIDKSAIETYSDLDDKTERHLSNKEMMLALDNLTPLDRQILLLSIEGISSKEIAVTLAITENYALHRRMLAMRSLRLHLKEYFPTTKVTETENVVQESVVSAKMYAQLSFTGESAASDDSLPTDEILNDDYQLLQYSRKGISSEHLGMILDAGPFSLAEWGRFINMDQARLQEILTGKESITETFATRIFQIFRIVRKGESVFGTKKEFYLWLKQAVPALGNVHPISLLDNTFGAQIIQDELIRIEHGVMA